MKSVTFFSFCLAQLLFSCLAEQNNELVVGNCQDNIKNQNEVDVDCGGVCEKQCVILPPVVVPCEDDLEDNLIVLNGVELELSDDEFFGSQENGYFEIYVNTPGWTELRINIYGELPTKDTEYKLDPSYDLDEGEASIEYIDFFTFHSFQGELYVRYENEKWYIEVCPVTLIGQDWTEADFSGRVVYEE